MRGEVAAVLQRKQSEGVLSLRGDPADVAELLFVVGDGAALRILAEPDRDHDGLLRACGDAVRPLLAG